MTSGVTRSKQVLGGTPVIRGTRVPVKALIDYLEAGDSIDVFLQDFPSVSRRQVLAVLEEAKDLLPLVPGILSALETIGRGDHVIIPR